MTLLVVTKHAMIYAVVLMDTSNLLPLSPNILYGHYPVENYV